MANEIKKTNNQPTPVNNMRNLLSNKGMQSMFDNALKGKAGPFLASIIDLYNGDDYLQKCDPKEVAMEALKAATLNLPINKSLGFAYIVPYKGKPAFMIGYKGLVQLAMRTGQYKALNSGVIYEGMELEEDYLSGTFKITGRPVSDKALGYFAYFKLINGFEKALYMSADEIEAYGKKYSQSFTSKYSPWQSEFDEMAKKTVMRRLLSKYGVLTTEMQKLEMQEEDIYVESTVRENANVVELESGVVADAETGEVIEGQQVIDEITAPF